MNQFKDVFLGKNKRDYSKATSSQKCIRVGGKHNDLDNVGHTSRHLTFFEMLGNFSFGDYFKKEAMEFAWIATHEVFEFETERLWVTIFEDDDESYELWQKHVKPERIVRMGEKENFWAMGDTGPCGPCSELYYDRGEKFGDAPSPKEDKSGERYLEFWNLVFMESNRDSNGKLSPLPNQSIDTGSGLERVVSLKMGVDNVFHTDILRHLIAQIEKTTGKKYDPNDAKTAPAFHVIADHIRSLSFSMADGAQPSNLDRGYVLRKLLRRAVRYGRTLLGTEEPFLAEIFPALLEMMGDDYHAIRESKDRICEILTLEEEGFIRTLKRGGNILHSVIDKALDSPHKQISGEDAFKLKDTYGFPLEEILLIAKDSNLQVNIDAYQLLEEKAREISRAARSVEKQEAKENHYKEFIDKHGACKFIGYSETKGQTEVLGILKEGEFVQNLSAGQDGIVILKETPFYSEKGGQIGDTGVLSNETARFIVEDCQSPYPNIIIHIGKLEEGILQVGSKICAAVDATRRFNIAAHHTATHLLHYALQKILGQHIRQAGSLVEPDRLRFDFNHHKPLTDEQIIEIEDLVNEKIRENQSVNTYEISFEEAQNRPEIKQFFGEKYGSHVRVVDINYSKELCGGTHAYHVGMLGYFRISKESSIAAGVRRIEAICGKVAEQFVREEESRMKEVAALLKTPPQKLPEKMGQMLDEMTNLRLQIKSLKQGHLAQLSDELAGKAKNHLLLETVEVESEDLAELAKTTLEKMNSGVVVLALLLDVRVQIVIRVSKDFVEKGVSAKALIQEIGPHIGGGGGGKPDSAQAGGKNPSGLETAFETIRSTLKKIQ